MGRLDGKTAIVTGASRGIGEGIALCFAREGANLVLCATQKANLEECVKKAETYGVRCVTVEGNVADPEISNRLTVCAVSEFQTLDIVVACAGINRDGMLHKMTDERWQEVLDVNLNGTFYLIRSAAKQMRKQKSGRIITISSAAWKGNLGQANYAASKAGIAALTQTAARELGRYQITCNTICPGFIDTDMTLSMPQSAREEMCRKIWLGRTGKPSDIGELAAFLASDAAAYITGEVISVGGGLIL